MQNYFQFQEIKYLYLLEPLSGSIRHYTDQYQHYQFQ